MPTCVSYDTKFGVICDKVVSRKDKSMWLDNLKQLKIKTGMSSKQIAEVANLPERTVVRIFSGDTPNPYVDTLHRIVVVLGGSLDDILADSNAVVGTHNLASLQSDVDRLKSENEVLAAENAVLKDNVGILAKDNENLRIKLAHKEEIISLHDQYRAILGKLAKEQPKNLKRK